MTDSEILYWLTLSGLSVKKQKQIIKIAGSVTKIKHEFAINLEIKEICSDKYANMLRTFEDDYVKESLNKLGCAGIKVCTVLNPLYPDALKQQEVNAPLAFYYKGDLNLLNTPCIAVVGTRHSSRYGKDMTYKFVSGLVKGGFTIVSGLATGIDGYAHHATLENNGKTIAVLGSGLNIITPVSNCELYDKILNNGGLIISEYPPNANATKYTFPERNRIISGLSKGVLVVEAGEKSGALITADFALEQGRDVFAVVGNLDSSRSVGTNNLIFNGATMARNGEDICAFYGITLQKISQEEVKKLDNTQKTIYILLSEGEKSFDELVELSGKSLAELSVILTDMELDGLIERTTADNYIITEK